MSFRRAEVRYLLDGYAHAAAVGEVAWRTVNGALRGEVDVYATGFQEGELVLIVNIGRPNKPSFGLLIRRDNCHRLDVNTPHRQFPSTHVQWRDDSTDPEKTRDAREEFPPIPSSGPVGGRQYDATLRAFAAYLNIDTSAMEWVDPPDGEFR